MGAVAPVFFVSVVAVLYVGLCIVLLLWGGVICRAEKGLVLWFFDVRRCGFAVFLVVCGVCVIRIDVGGTLGDVDVLCVAVFFML